MLCTMFKQIFSSKEMFKQLYKISSTSIYPMTERSHKSVKYGRPLNKRMKSSLRIAKELLMNKDHHGSNIVFSPLSVNALLCLVAAGCGGATLDQFLDFLDSETLDDINSFASKLISTVCSAKGAGGGGGGSPLLSFASGAWLEQSLSLKQSFKQVVHGVHKTAALNSVDFKNKYEEVRLEVNSWAGRETNGLITEVLPPVSLCPNTVLVLANALYFKGSWIKKFDQSESKHREFHLSNGSSIQVPFMTSLQDQFVSQFDGFKVLRLPYEYSKEDEHRFSMYFFLPDAIDCLPALSERLLTESGFLEGYLPKEEKKVGDFKIPKFKICFGFEASELLKDLGLDLPFSEAGGLTEMVEIPNGGQAPVVSGIFHKSFVEVNEEGTEAAAVTAGFAELTCYRPPIDFVADHPFLFIIRDDVTGVVLFIGRLLDPSEHQVTC